MELSARKLPFSTFTLFPETAGQQSTLKNQLRYPWEQHPLLMSNSAFLIFHGVHPLADKLITKLPLYKSQHLGAISHRISITLFNVNYTSNKKN